MSCLRWVRQRFDGCFKRRRRTCNIQLSDSVIRIRGNKCSVEKLPNISETTFFRDTTEPFTSRIPRLDLKTESLGVTFHASPEEIIRDTDTIISNPTYKPNIDESFRDVPLNEPADSKGNAPPIPPRKKKTVAEYLSDYPPPSGTAAIFDEQGIKCCLQSDLPVAADDGLNKSNDDFADEIRRHPSRTFTATPNSSYDKTVTSISQTLVGSLEYGQSPVASVADSCLKKDFM